MKRIRTAVMTACVVGFATIALAGCLPLPAAPTAPVNAPIPSQEPTQSTTPTTEPEFTQAPTPTAEPEPTQAPTPSETTAATPDEDAYIAAVEQIVAEYQGLTVEEFRAGSTYDSAIEGAVGLGYLSCTQTVDEFVGPSVDSGIPDTVARQIYDAAQTYLCV